MEKKGIGNIYIGFFDFFLDFCVGVRNTPLNSYKSIPIKEVKNIERSTAKTFEYDC